MWISFPFRIVIGIISITCISLHIQADTLRCCSKANGSCRSLCEKLSLVSMATDIEERDSKLYRLNELCPNPSMVSFWTCVNETLDEINKGKGWIGRPCCRIPQSEKCKMACLRAQSVLDLTTSCRKSDEIAFFTCIERQESGERCCRNAQTSKCSNACKDVFAGSFTPSKEVRDAVNKYCSVDNPRVQQCVQIYIHVTPVDHPLEIMHCCESAASIQCRTSCKQILRTETTAQEVLDSLERKGCGPVLPHERFWQCLLMVSAANEPGGSLVQSEKMGMDSAKLQCCFIAATTYCKRLCIETFTNNWRSWGEFQQNCKYQHTESKMIKCLAEVAEPCELGCKNLSYCTNFNHRPTELFRSCNARADFAAELAVRSWQNGMIELPMTKIPVLNVSECHPQFWKTIACALQIKPCRNDVPGNLICKSDCIDILNKCIDRKRLPPNQNPVTLCELLSPLGNETPCISLAPYLMKSKDISTALEVTHPCKPNPCEGDNPNICMVERNCLIGQKCKQHVCVGGCRMGDLSKFIVPRNSHLRVPSNTHSANPQCHMVCYCNHENHLEDCMTPPCLGSDNCWHEGKRYNHNMLFKSDCKTCFCYDGEITCSPRSCGSSLPCACQDHYVPVCGANGKTYPSACLARCIGLTDDQFEFGACYDSDPCSPNSCHPYHRCVPKKRVCLSIRHRSCKQYDCVNMQTSCKQQPKFPVCDTDNVEHLNICWMLQRRKNLAYYGKCMPHCRSNGLICGHNGETYTSECAAWAERVSVDYKGACSAVGSKYGESSRCSAVRCPPLPSEHCTKVFPPGGCCPICGAAVRLLYSQKLSDWSVEATRDVEPVVIQIIAEKLRQHVKVTECEVFAYLSLESDIIVLVIAITDSPTKLQVEACVHEAEKIQSLIDEQSPTLLTELPLSFFTTATMIEAVSDNVAQLTFNVCLVLVLTVSNIYVQRIL